MKIRNLKLATLILSLSFAFGSAAEARDHHIRTYSEDTITHTSARSETSVSENSGFSLGFSSYSGLYTAGGESLPSLAALISLGHNHHLQINLSFAGTSPTFLFMGGAIYKYSVLEHGGYGFHIGGGGVFGTNGSFNMLAGGVAGFHFPFPGTNNQLTFHFDGGPMVAVNGGTANFAMSPLSTLLGLSVFYTF